MCNAGVGCCQGYPLLSEAKHQQAGARFEFLEIPLD